MNLLNRTSNRNDIFVSCFYFLCFSISSVTSCFQSKIPTRWFFLSPIMFVQKVMNSAFNLNFNFAKQVAGSRFRIHSPSSLRLVSASFFLFFIGARFTDFYTFPRWNGAETQQIKLHTKFRIGFSAEELCFRKLSFLFLPASADVTPKKMISIIKGIEGRCMRTNPDLYAWWLLACRKKLKFKSLCTINFNANWIQCWAKWKKDLTVVVNESLFLT